jgi:hypothetical protein
MMGRRSDPKWVWQQVWWPRPLTPDAALELLDRIAADDQLGRVAFEARSQKGQISYFVGIQPDHARALDFLLTSLLPGLRMTKPKPSARLEITFAGHLKTTHPSLALNVDRVTAITRAVLAGLASTTEADETLVLQIILGGRLSPRFVAPDALDPTQHWFDLLRTGSRTVNADTRTSLKIRSSLHGCKTTIRIGTNTKSSGRTRALITSVLGGLRVAQAAGVRINFIRESPSHIIHASLPWRWPLQLSSRELISLMGWPLDTTGEALLPGHPPKNPKLIPPPNHLEPSAHPFAEATAPGADMQFGISAPDTLQHTLLLGPTASGKSTAMLALIMDAIRSGRGVLVIDPKTDLVNDVLARIPDDRVDDVVVIDPTDSRPVGLNPLRGNGRHVALTADSMLAVFKELSGDSWGPRTEDVLTSALLTLAHYKGATLTMLPALLTDERFRKKLTRGIDDHFGLNSFWASYEAMSPQQRAQVIAPTMTRLRQFLLRPQLRAVLGQTEPKFDLVELFTRRKIVLVSLNRGQIGTESARLLGSIIVGQLWPLILARAGLPPERRRIVNIFIDEVQDYLALPTDLEDALSQARSLGVGFTIAHQYRRQLPSGLRSGVDANARNKIIFGLNFEDAAELAKQAPELEAQDFMYLPRFGIYTSLMQNGSSTGWFSGRTLPPEAAVREPADLRVRSARLYGHDPVEVEAQILAEIGVAAGETTKRSDPEDRIGRRPDIGAQP